MANKLAVLKFTLSYPAPGGGTNQVPSTTSSVPFLAQDEGTIDVVATTPMTTDFDIPFGAIDTGATLLIVFNKVGQELILSVNSGAIIESIPAGEVAIIAPGNKLGGTPVTAAKVTTTDVVAADGSVEFLVFGDPA